MHLDGVECALCAKVCCGSGQIVKGLCIKCYAKRAQVKTKLAYGLNPNAPKRPRGRPPFKSAATPSQSDPAVPDPASLLTSLKEDDDVVANSD